MLHWFHNFRPVAVSHNTYIGTHVLQQCRCGVKKETYMTGIWTLAQLQGKL